ncbi:MAG: hypothetical protein V4454_21735 [Pseudomonadota bacterium]
MNICVHYVRRMTAFKRRSESLKTANIAILAVLIACSFLLKPPATLWGPFEAKNSLKKVLNMASGQ